MYSFYCFYIPGTCLRLVRHSHSMVAVACGKSERARHSHKWKYTVRRIIIIIIISFFVFIFFFFLFSFARLSVMFVRESFKFRNAFRICVPYPLGEFNAMSMAYICVWERARPRSYFAAFLSLRLQNCGAARLALVNWKGGCTLISSK